MNISRFAIKLRNQINLFQIDKARNIIRNCKIIWLFKFNRLLFLQDIVTKDLTIKNTLKWIYSAKFIYEIIYITNYAIWIDWVSYDLLRIIINSFIFKYRNSMMPIFKECRLFTLELLYLKIFLFSISLIMVFQIWKWNKVKVINIIAEWLFCQIP